MSPILQNTTGGTRSKVGSSLDPLFGRVRYIEDTRSAGPVPTSTVFIGASLVDLYFRQIFSGNPSSYQMIIPTGEQLNREFNNAQVGDSLDFYLSTSFAGTVVVPSDIRLIGSNAVPASNPATFTRFTLVKAEEVVNNPIKWLLLGRGNS